MHFLAHWMAVNLVAILDLIPELLLDPVQYLGLEVGVMELAMAWIQLQWAPILLRAQITIPRLVPMLLLEHRVRMINLILHLARTPLRLQVERQ
ncbi:hypothetical protein WK09_22495 [Burkholderia ubonensis]|nr:hypothetical protein WK09_22495 [Burkholderia ubonensis]